MPLVKSVSRTDEWPAVAAMTAFSVLRSRLPALVTSTRRYRAFATPGFMSLTAMSKNWLPSTWPPSVIDTVPAVSAPWVTGALPVNVALATCAVTPVVPISPSAVPTRPARARRRARFERARCLRASHRSAAATRASSSKRIVRTPSAVSARGARAREAAGVSALGPPGTPLARFLATAARRPFLARGCRGAGAPRRSP